MKTLLGLLVLSLHTQAQVVVRPELHRKIELRIVRAQPDSFSTYALTNHNGREMTLVCAGNRVYDENPKAFLEYRNYYNEIVANFEIDRNAFCLELGKFIEGVQARISESDPLIFVLDTRSQKVEKIVYPKLDIYADKGSHEDLLPKAKVMVQDFKPKVEKPALQIKHK